MFWILIRLLKHGILRNNGEKKIFEDVLTTFFKLKDLYNGFMLPGSQKTYFSVPYKE